MVNISLYYLGKKKCNLTFCFDSMKAAANFRSPWMSIYEVVKRNVLAQYWKAKQQF